VGIAESVHEPRPGVGHDHGKAIISGQPRGFCECGFLGGVEARVT
jgi:hypothetical protein